MSMQQTDVLKWEPRIAEFSIFHLQLFKVPCLEHHERRIVYFSLILLTSTSSLHPQMRTRDHVSRVDSANPIGSPESPATMVCREAGCFWMSPSDSWYPIGPVSTTGQACSTIRDAKVCPQLPPAIEKCLLTYLSIYYKALGGSKGKERGSFKLVTSVKWMSHNTCMYTYAYRSVYMCVHVCVYRYRAMYRHTA